MENFCRISIHEKFSFWKFRKNIKIHGIEKLKNIKNDGPIIFISGHFSNFELMAMAIEKRNKSFSNLQTSK